MEKNWYQSKTIWGGLLFAASAFATQTGLLPPTVVTGFVQWVGAALGVTGLRDALD